MTQPTLDGPLDHLQRVCPPWRTQEFLTECGRPAAEHNPGWDRNPVAVIARDCDRSRWSRHDDTPPPKAANLHRELLALAELVAAHRDEFDALIAGLADTTSLADARARRRRRRA